MCKILLPIFNKIRNYLNAREENKLENVNEFILNQENQVQKKSSNQD